MLAALLYLFFKICLKLAFISDTEYSMTSGKECSNGLDQKTFQNILKLFVI